MRHNKTTPRVTIRMGAAHSDITVAGDPTCDHKPLPSDSRELWAVGQALSTAKGYKGPTPGVKANTSKAEPLVTIKTKRTAKPNGKPHNQARPAKPGKDNHKPRHGHASTEVRPSEDVHAAKKRSGGHRKPRPVPASGPDPRAGSPRGGNPVRNPVPKPEA